MSDLTHLDDAGHARMVDVAAREVDKHTFYHLREDGAEAVEVLAIVTKEEAARWLAGRGTPGA